LWFEIAKRTGCSVQRAKAETTSTEFLMWQSVIKDEANAFHREDWFYAQLCYQIYLLRLSFSGGQNKLKLEDFLIKFDTAGTNTRDVESNKLPHGLTKPVEEMTEDEIWAEKVRISKEDSSIFFAALGMDKDGKFMYSNTLNGGQGK